MAEWFLAYGVKKERAGSDIRLINPITMIKQQHEFALTPFHVYTDKLDMDIGDITYLYSGENIEGKDKGGIFGVGVITDIIEKKESKAYIIKICLRNQENPKNPLLYTKDSGLLHGLATDKGSWVKLEDDDPRLVELKDIISKSKF